LEQSPSNRSHDRPEGHHTSSPISKISVESDEKAFGNTHGVKLSPKPSLLVKNKSPALSDQSWDVTLPDPALRRRTPRHQLNNEISTQ
jgi:hypothetical protein